MALGWICVLVDRDSKRLAEAVGNVDDVSELVTLVEHSHSRRLGRGGSALVATVHWSRAVSKALGDAVRGFCLKELE